MAWWRWFVAIWGSAAAINPSPAQPHPNSPISSILTDHDISQQDVLLVLLGLDGRTQRRVGPQHLAGAGLVPTQQVHQPTGVHLVQLGDELQLGAEGQAVLLLLL